MAGFFGTISTTSCVNDLFYGTDYHSHLGTRRAGMATFDKEKGFKRSIHNIQNSHFRTKFEHELDEFAGNAGIGMVAECVAIGAMEFDKLVAFAVEKQIDLHEEKIRVANHRIEDLEHKGE